MVNNIQLSDGSVKEIKTENADLVVSKDTAENLAKKSLNTTRTNVSINGLSKLNPLQKAKVAVR